MSAGAETTDGAVGVAEAAEAAGVGELSEFEVARDSGELTSAEIDRGFFLLAITSFIFYIGFQIVQAIQPNFFRDVIGMNGAQMMLVAWWEFGAAAGTKKSGPDAEKRASHPSF